MKDMQEILKQEPYAWATEEFDINGRLVWSSITKFRPKELSWIRDLPTKKHYITITPLSINVYRAYGTLTTDNRWWGTRDFRATPV